MNRNYLFTWNNYTEDSEKYLRSLAGVRYCCGGYEVAPTTGTPHIQGYIMWKDAKSLSATIKLLPGCHITPASTVEEGIAYCKKEGKYFEFGVPPVSRKRKGEMEKERWAEARKKACTGRMKEIEDELFIRYYSTFKKMEKDHMVTLPCLEILDNQWIYGPSGSGKSRMAREENPGSYYKMANKWWDGYEGQETVIIEDLDKAHGVLGHHLKIWADHGAFIAETKGAGIMIRPKKIIVTSNYCPSDIWQETEMLEPIMRRFKLIYKPL